MSAKPDKLLWVRLLLQGGQQLTNRSDCAITETQGCLPFRTLHSHDTARISSKKRRKIWFIESSGGYFARC